MRYHDKPFYSSVQLTSRNFSGGFFGVMDNIPSCGTPMGTLGSEQGVQQGDPLGPLLLSLVLHKPIASGSECSKLLFTMWYLDVLSQVLKPQLIVLVLPFSRLVLQGAKDQYYQV